MSINQNARQLNWSQIEQFWFYDDLHFDGTRSPIKIPTLQEWLNEFQNDTRLKLIWLDVKAKDEDSIGAIAKSLSEIIPKYLKAKIQFSANTDGKPLHTEAKILILSKNHCFDILIFDKTLQNSHFENIIFDKITF